MSGADFAKADAVAVAQGKGHAGGKLGPDAVALHRRAVASERHQAPGPFVAGEEGLTLRHIRVIGFVKCDGGRGLADLAQAPDGVAVDDFDLTVLVDEFGCRLGGLPGGLELGGEPFGTCARA